MYLAYYQGVDGRSLFQALIRFPKLVMQGRDSSWTVAYGAFIEDLFHPDVDFAYRIGNWNGSINRFVLISSHNRVMLSDLAERADQLNTIVEASAVMPRSLAEHDRDASLFPVSRRGIIRQPYYAGRFVIPSNFYAYPLSSELLLHALSSGTDFALQVNCRRHNISSEELRSARKGFTDLHLSGLCPAHVLAHVSRQLDELPERTYLVDECIAAASPGMLNTVGRVIDAEFRRVNGQVGFSDSPQGDPPPNEEIVMGLHSSYFDDGPTHYVWRSVAAASLGAFLGWIPDEAFASHRVVNAVHPMGMKKTHIFLSYASGDREKAKFVASALEQFGWSVWWDTRINAGEVFDEVIEQALDQAQCCVVLWSQNSVQSRWVRSEATHALERGVLVPASLDRTRIPLEFMLVQTADLAEWTGRLPSPIFDKLVGGIRNVIGRSPGNRLADEVAHKINAKPV
jgi:hypothetical protein